MPRLSNQKPGIRLRVVLAPDIAFGPGKADLLAGIEETGSIAAAGRGMAMSYKRAWFLIESLNQSFREPLVVAAKGGKDGGGAALTAFGRKMLESYRHMEAATEKAIAKDVAKLRRSLRDISE